MSVEIIEKNAALKLQQHYKDTSWGAVPKEVKLKCEPLLQEGQSLSYYEEYPTFALVWIQQGIEIVSAIYLGDDES